jgi:hypothetical protein
MVKITYSQLALIARGPFLPRARPFSAVTLSTRSASSGERQKGIITTTLVKPISRRRKRSPSAGSTAIRPECLSWFASDVWSRCGASITQAERASCKISESVRTNEDRSDREVGTLRVVLPLSACPLRAGAWGKLTDAQPKRVVFGDVLPDVG